jgi:hypothetical protein
VKYWLFNDNEEKNEQTSQAVQLNCLFFFRGYFFFILKEFGPPFGRGWGYEHISKQKEDMESMKLHHYLVIPTAFMPILRGSALAGTHFDAVTHYSAA